jgi:hypothetical protein
MLKMRIQLLQNNTKCSVFNSDNIHAAQLGKLNDKFKQTSFKLLVFPLVYELKAFSPSHQTSRYILRTKLSFCLTKQIP